jgi:L-ascorbate metabolism protein UlaG (beta-lactamase superfamily)
LRLAALNSDQVRITFIGHASFLIESPQLVRIATDYNDYVRPPVLPDIATMNHAHSTHYTDRPDPAIKYVLRGWGATPEEPARWDLKYRDVRVRNVPPTSEAFTAAPSPSATAIPFSFSRSQICVSPIWVICITR